jgi:hypothetical protein
MKPKRVPIFAVTIALALTSVTGASLAKAVVAVAVAMAAVTGAATVVMAAGTLLVTSTGTTEADIAATPAERATKKPQQIKSLLR